MINPQQQRFLGLMMRIVIMQLVLIILASIFLTNASLAIALACLGYDIAYGSYGMLYFRHRGAAERNKIMKALIYGSVVKYLCLFGFCYLVISYSRSASVDISLDWFFAGILVNHLIIVLFLMPQQFAKPSSSPN